MIKHISATQAAAKPGELSPFDLRWLAETQQNLLREQGRSPESWLPISGNDILASPPLPKNASGSEGLILQQALRLANATNVLQMLQQWRRQVRLIFIVLLLLALIAGFSAAVTALGSTRQPVNILWLVGTLLGPHMILLLVWILSILLSRHAAGGGPGSLWLWLSTRFAPPSQRAVAVSYATLSSQGGLLRWQLSLITHSVWMAGLAGAGLGLLLSLSLRSYSFVWETTILPADVFVRVVDLMAWLPAQLGLTVPGADMVRSSSLDSAQSPAFSPDAVRQAWSSWLLGCLMVYGLAPRLLLVIVCWLQLQHRMSSVRLDLTAPHWAVLAARLNPGSHNSGITDPDPGKALAPRFGHNASARGRPVMLGLELDSSVSWPPPTVPDIQSMDIILTGEQRRQALALLQRLAPARLLIACDGSLSPDRGSLRWLAECSCLAGNSAIWLTNLNKASEGRRDSWTSALMDMGLEANLIFVNEPEALLWLQNDRPGGMS